MSNLAISVRGLGKSYVIAHQEKPTLASEALLAKIRNPFGRVSQETFWALKDVSFDVEKGDVVGIIGRNGAGKSTLLKVLSRITTPTTGEVRIYGRVGSLLEVGTGFHPELTGRENIFLNGSILGMRRSEIQKQFDAIVDFAEVEKFLDTPVKRYSSGMYVRLAFAVAAHLNPEILIVDEVLAVGDAQFQKKCLGKMQDVSRREGRTVLFVSHNMAAVRKLCRGGLFLESGGVSYEGDAESAVGKYLGSRWLEVEMTNADQPVRVAKFSTFTSGIRSSEVTFGYPFQIAIDLDANEEALPFWPNMTVVDQAGERVFSICLPEEGRPAVTTRTARLITKFSSLKLVPGSYSVEFGAYHEKSDDCLHPEGLVGKFEVLAGSMPGSDKSYRRHHGLFRPEVQVEVT